MRTRTSRPVKHTVLASRQRTERDPRSLSFSAEATAVVGRDHAGVLLLLGAVAMSVVAIASLRLRQLLTRLTRLSAVTLERPPT